MTLAYFLTGGLSRVPALIPSRTIQEIETVLMSRTKDIEQSSSQTGAYQLQIIYIKITFVIILIILKKTSTIRHFKSICRPQVPLGINRVSGRPCAFPYSTIQIYLIT